MLLEISNVVIGMLNDARAKGLVFGSAEMDRFCVSARALCAAQRGVVMPEQHDDSLAVHPPPSCTTAKATTRWP